MIDTNTPAARAFYRLVADFAKRTKPWQPAIFYQTLPDERWDLTLVSRRVYGNRHEFLAVMASAGISRFDEPLTERKLILPTAQQLTNMKRTAGFESMPDYRLDFKPTWAD